MSLTASSAYQIKYPSRWRTDTPGENKTERINAVFGEKKHGDIDAIHGAMFLLQNFKGVLKKGLKNNSDFKFIDPDMSGYIECLHCLKNFYDKGNKEVLYPDCVDRIVNEIIEKKSIKDITNKLIYISKAGLADMTEKFRKTGKDTDFPDTLEHLSKYK